MSPSKIDIDGITVYYCNIDGGDTRRQAECAAVEFLLDKAELTGPMSHDDNGAPFLAAHHDLCISVSHSRRIAALAVSHEPVGIDVEEWRSTLPRVLPRVLNADELTTWADHPLHAWTAKEALYKAALTPGLDFSTQILLAPATASSPTITPASVLGTPYTVTFTTLGDTLLAIAKH